MRKIQFILILFLLAVGLWLTPGVVFAARTTRNFNTGAGSINTTRINDRRTYTDDIILLGSVSSDDTNTQTTGGNALDDNTGGANTLVSGETEVNLDNTPDGDDVNDLWVEIDQTNADDEEALAENDTTGAGSVNTAEIVSEKIATVSAMSTGGVVNTSNVTLTTGGNSVSRNTGGENSLTSGDATSTITRKTTVNLTTVKIRQ